MHLIGYPPVELMEDITRRCESSPFLTFERPPRARTAQQPYDGKYQPPGKITVTVRADICPFLRDDNIARPICSYEESRSNESADLGYPSLISRRYAPSTKVHSMRDLRFLGIGMKRTARQPENTRAVEETLACVLNTVSRHLRQLRKDVRDNLFTVHRRDAGFPRSCPWPGHGTARHVWPQMKKLSRFGSKARKFHPSKHESPSICRGRRSG